MKKFLKKLHRGEKGFTLIELLVVIGILALLIAVVALNVGKFIGKGACESYCVEKHNVQTAVIAYMAENEGEVPSIAEAEAYMIGSPVHTWPAPDTEGVVGEASDIPTDCVCGE